MDIEYNAYTDGGDADVFAHEFIDTSTGNQIFAQYSEALAPVTGSARNYGASFTFDGIPQCAVGLPTSYTGSGGVIVANATQFNPRRWFTATGTGFINSSAMSSLITYFGADFDSDILKVGTNSAGSWAEFYTNGGELIRQVMVRKRDSLDGNGVLSQNWPKTFEDADEYSIMASITESTPSRGYVSVDSQTATSVTTNVRDFNTVAGFDCDLYGEWIKG